MTAAAVAVQAEGAETMSDLILVTLGPAWGLPFQSCAPFSIKLEVWLRMAEIPYRGRIENNPGRGPKGKSPWIETEKGIMGDTELIIAWLKQTRGVDPDEELTPLQRAEGLAWRRLFEEHYHQVWEYLTFLTPAGMSSAREWFGQFPALPRPLIRALMIRGLRRQLYARGVGRHSLEDIERMGSADIDAAATYLGDRPFWLGDEPTTTDCTAFAFLALTIWTPPISAVHERAREHANLVAFCERMGALFFADEMNGLLEYAARPESARFQAA